MAMGAVVAGTLAVTGAAPAAAATPAQSGTAPISSFVGCASLTGNSNGRATVKNICSSNIHATVSVDWAWDPDCKAIAPGRTVTFTWDSTYGRAEYAYDC
ncbi:hypothetical protein [Micromonospora sp. NPDC002575]|uniref:hypothetical protein n=1 Tax=Micromonospora sp. NPDC002575 TaxID=3364222 RepID=UPI00369BA8FF